MVPALIAKPLPAKPLPATTKPVAPNSPPSYRPDEIPQEKQTRRSKRVEAGKPVSRVTSSVIHDEYSASDEDRYFSKLIFLLVMAFVLPAMLVLAYLIIFPDALTQPITPQYDFSNWQLGQRPELLGR
ncbi:hypothetical protein [Stieleria varia]|uniref:Uncharacterized protein n=1 Tax=Stieleria varia TaxID=2528005 RepID=A0A5C6AXF5_9BACT|nr:hypothetical protein [Stieleria varia]TWU04685.1 hypothetical protein Pla52n_27270 [Stieleria varia]